MQLIDIPWPGAATLMWDRDEVLDITSGQRGNFFGSLTSRLINMTYRDYSWGIATLRTGLQGNREISVYSGT
jgi:hypothetical protein